ncbi:MAG: helix-turn-helix domain-containing protein [Burkholderiaceae bacterium]|nr:helix-turn-helix domain-containing protein [Burkholderiaceae bacterium]
MRKASTAHRSEIAALKRQVKALASAVKAGGRASVLRAQQAEPSAPTAIAPRGIRFSAQRFAVQRAKLGLTQAQVATLLGASYLSVHKWEGGKVQPRAAQLQKIAAMMKMGKREAMRQLQA